MKYSLPNRISLQYLKQADEIKIQKSDCGKTIDYIEDYPEAEIVLCVGDLKQQFSGNEEVIANTLKMYKEESNKKFSIELEHLNEDIALLKELEIPFFWKYPVTTFDELQALKELGVSQVLIDGPLFFQMREVKRFHIPIRVIPNVCYENYLPRANGLHGTWMRPQDQDLYDQYVSILEFKEKDFIKLEALFDIYSKDKTYFGDLNTLFTNFGFTTPILAAAVPRDVIKSRLNCGQRCTQNRCHLCERGLSVGLQVQTSEYIRVKEQN